MRSAAWAWQPVWGLVRALSWCKASWGSWGKLEKPGLPQSHDSQSSCGLGLECVCGEAPGYIQATGLVMMVMVMGVTASETSAIITSDIIIITTTLQLLHLQDFAE